MHLAGGGGWGSGVNTLILLVFHSVLHAKRGISCKIVYTINGRSPKCMRMRTDMPGHKEIRALSPTATNGHFIS